MELWRPRAPSSLNLRSTPTATGPDDTTPLRAARTLAFQSSKLLSFLLQFLWGGGNGEFFGDWLKSSVCSFGLRDDRHSRLHSLRRRPSLSQGPSYSVLSLSLSFVLPVSFGFFVCLIILKVLGFFLFQVDGGYLDWFLHQCCSLGGMILNTFFC